MKRFAGIALFATLTLPLSAAHAAAPANDNIASATPLTLTSQTVTGSTTDATLEAGEPESLCGSLQNSVWYSLPAVRAGLVLSMATDHGFAVYSVPATGGPSIVTCSAPGEGSKRFLMNNTAPVAHLIQVGNNAGAAGAFSMGIFRHADPANDNRANATEIAAATGTLTLDTYAATRETPEPTVTCNSDAQATVWYKITPATTMTLSVDTSGTDFDTVIQIHKGNTTGALTALGCNNDRNRELGTHSRIAATLKSGSTYLLQVGTRGSGTNLTGIRGGNLTMSLFENGNDEIMDAAFIDGIGSFTGSTVGSTAQAAEADAPCGTTGGPSVWYQVGAVQAAEGLAIASADAEIAVFHPTGALIACSNGSGGVTIPYVNRLANGVWLFNAVLVRMSTDAPKPIGFEVYRGAFVGAKTDSASATVRVNSDSRSAAGTKVCVTGTCQGV